MSARIGAGGVLVLRDKYGDEVEFTPVAHVTKLATIAVLGNQVNATEHDLQALLSWVSTELAELRRRRTA